MEKMKYEKPVVLDLGEMANGMWLCAAGNGNYTSTCNPGGSAADSACPSGTLNTASTCTDGSTASFGSSNCEAGTDNSNLTVCSAGTTPG